MNETRPLRFVVSLLLVTALAAAPLSPPLLAAPTGSIRLSVQPATLLADGQSTATVVADVRNSRGDRPPDGTLVRFTTTVGSIEESAPTIAGVARARFTSAPIPDTAIISAYAEGASATVRLPMVRELRDLKTGRRIARVQGRWVAYSENLRILEAADDARLTFRGVAVTAQRLQLDLNTDTVRADGDVRVTAAGAGNRRGLSPGAPASSPAMQRLRKQVPESPSALGQAVDGSAGGLAGNAAPPEAGQAPSASDRNLPDAGSAGLLAGNGAPPTAPGPAPGDQPATRNDQAEHPTTALQAAGSPGAEQPERSEQSAEHRTASTEHDAAGAPELTGDRLSLKLRDLEGLLLSREEAVAFAGADLQQQPPPPRPATLMTPLVDLSESDLLWTARRALVFLGDRIQLTGARPYWVGARLLPLGYQEIPLDGSEVGTDRYVGVGSDGLIVDLPWYLSMGAGGSTALRLRHKERSGFGFFAQNRGWRLDLERKYGEPGGVEGLITLDTISPDWGLRWTHTHPFDEKTRLYAYLDFPQHRDLYGQLNFNKSWGFLSSTLSLSANRLRGRPMGHSINLGLETRPWSLGAGFRLSLEGRWQDSRGGEFIRLNNRRFQVPGITQQQIGLRLRPPQLRFGPSTSLTSSLTVRQAWGHREGVGLVGAVNFTQRLGGSSSFSLNYNYNQVPGLSALRNTGRQNLSATLFYQPGDRFRLTAFGLMGLDSPIRSLTAAVSYKLTPSWRIDFQQTLFQFDLFRDHDFQIGIARALGPREILLYWSRARHRLAIEIGVSQF